MATTKPKTAVVALDPSEGLLYDGFISYSHAADDLLAPRLQSGLQRFAKPWWKRRALRIFRDESPLSANPHLWSSITEALDRSDWFVLLLSPGAADSEWVNQEVEYWLEHKDRNRIIPVLTAGDFGWSDGDVAGDAPPALSGAFTDEPRWVDLRFARSDEQLDLNNASLRAAVADIASAIRQVPKDELESEEMRQHRRTRRTAWGAGAALLLLGVVATGATVFALGQSNEAQTQRDEALRQTAIAEAQTDFAEEQQQEAESQAEIAQQERDRAELSALETIAASQIADSQTARVTNSALANLLAVEARQRIDIELTQANLARNTLSPASVRVTRIPPGVNAGDVGPDRSWSVLGYRATEARQSSAAPRPSGDAVGGYVEDFDGITQRPGNLRYDLPALPPNLSFADPGPWVDLSDDGSRLVLWYGITGPNRREAIVLDASTFEPVGDPIPGPISGVAINPEGSLLAVGSPGGEVPLGTIDLITSTGEGVGSLPSGGHGQVDSFEFSGDGSRLFTQQFSSDEATVKVWDIAGQAMLFTKSLGPVFFSGAGAISQDGSYVAVATGGDPTSQGGASGLRQTPLQVTVLDAGTVPSLPKSGSRRSPGTASASTLATSSQCWPSATRPAFPSCPARRST